VAGHGEQVHHEPQEQEGSPEIDGRSASCALLEIVEQDRLAHGDLSITSNETAAKWQPPAATVKPCQISW
jgi:hypothetical protein